MEVFYDGRGGGGVSGDGDAAQSSPPLDHSLLKRNRGEVIWEINELMRLLPIPLFIHYPYYPAATYILSSTIFLFSLEPLDLP